MEANSAAYNSSWLDQGEEKEKEVAQIQKADAAQRKKDATAWHESNGNKVKKSTKRRSSSRSRRGEGVSAQFT